MQFGIKINIILSMSQEAVNKPIPRTQSKILVAVSRVFSFTFHPLLMTCGTAWLISEFAAGESLQLSYGKFGAWMRDLILYTAILPLFSILVLRLSGLVSNARMHLAKDRILPLIATLFFYILAYLVLMHNRAPLVLRSLLLGSSLGVLSIFVINLFYKVSVHTTAAAIPVGILLALMINDEISSLLALSIAVFTAVFVGIIRWLLGAHTFGQIILGYLIGILTQLAAYFFVISNGFSKDLVEKTSSIIKF
jgi:hypothetical protein